MGLIRRRAVVYRRRRDEVLAEIYGHRETYFGSQPDTRYDYVSTCCTVSLAQINHANLRRIAASEFSIDAPAVICMMKNSYTHVLLL